MYGLSFYACHVHVKGCTRRRKMIFHARQRFDLHSLHTMARRSHGRSGSIPISSTIFQVPQTRTSKTWLNAKPNNIRKNIKV
jgi:hypothetical protein